MQQPGSLQLGSAKQLQTVLQMVLVQLALALASLLVLQPAWLAVLRQAEQPLISPDLVSRQQASHLVLREWFCRV